MKLQCFPMITVVFTVVLFLGYMITELGHLWTVKNRKTLF